MKRPALWIGFPYLLGLVAASAVTGQFRIVLCAGIVVSALIVCLFSRTVWKYLLLSTLSCLIACCHYWHHETVTIGRQQAYVGRETVFTGEVTELSVYDSGYAGYVLTGYFQENSQETGIKIKLFCEDQNADYGDRIMISGIPERIQGNYIFDSAEYYQARNIFLEFGIMTEILEVEKDAGQGLFRKLVYGIYHWRTDRTEKILSRMGQETGGLLTGMLFGDKSAMSRETKRNFYRTGIGHILAVSGLHLDFLAACIGFLLKKCRAGRKFSFGILAAACSLFVICAGGTVSVKRACIMILISRSAGLFFRESDTLNALSVAVLLLGIENPFVIGSAAFWLSCTGAFGIGVAADYMTKQDTQENRNNSGFPGKILKNMLSFGWVFVIMLPVNILYFKEISLISPLSNLLLVPVCMLMLFLGAGAVCFGCEGVLAGLCCSGADFLGRCILRVSDFVAGLSWTHATLDSEIVIFLVLAGAGFVILVQILVRDRKFTGIAVMFVLGVTSLAVTAEDMLHMQELKIAVLGNASNCVVAVRSGTDAVFIDLSGHVKNAEYAAAYLEETGIRHIQEVYLNQSGEKMLHAYREYLTDPVPERYCSRKELSSETETESETEKLPESVILDSQELLFHGALLKIQENRLEIYYEDKLFLCASEKTGLEDLTEVSDILVIYGKSENIQPDCGILIILDKNKCYDTQDAYNYIGENNLEITIAENGRCKVRRLYDNS